MWRINRSIREQIYSIIIQESQQNDRKYFNLRYWGISKAYKNFLTTIKTSKQVIRKYKVVKFASHDIEKNKQMINKVFSSYIIKYNGYLERFFKLLFACSLGASGYTKRTVYDVKYFRILTYAVRFRKRNLLKKFFLLRSQREGYVTYRENMQKYFIISLFLINWCNYKRGGFIINNPTSTNFDLQKFFGGRVANFLETNIVFCLLRPIVTIFQFRLNALTKYIINQPCQMHFYLITNNEINATFLSRFIAKKVQYVSSYVRF